MKSKKFIPFLFILTLLLFNTVPAHAAQNKTQSSKKAYQQFLYKNREKNKYFQIVNIGNKNTPVLIIGTGKKEAVNGKTYFNNCKVYTFSDNHIKQMEPFQNYGGRFISLKKKKGKYYLCNGSLRHKPPCHNGIEKPRRSQLRGFLRATMSTFVFLAYWHYSICLSAFQVCPTSTTYKPYALQVLSLECSPLSFLPGGSPAIL